MHEKTIEELIEDFERNVAELKQMVYGSIQPNVPIIYPEDREEALTK